MKYLREVNEGSDEKFVTYSAKLNGLEIEIGKSWIWDFSWDGKKRNMEISDWAVYIDGKIQEKFGKLSDAKNFIKNM